MGVHVVVGRGAVGGALAAHLRGQGHEVRVLSRRGGGGTVAVDAADPAALTAAAGGAEALYNCVNPAYHRWATDWPPVAAALLAAAERTGAVLVTTGNLYGHGPVDGPITADTPLRPGGTKGEVRARMWQDALAAHRAGRVRVAEARGSDFVGPGVDEAGHLGGRVVPRVLAGRPVRLVVPVDVPHAWTNVLDMAATLAVLGTEPAAWGRAWLVPTAPPVTAREAVDGLAAAAGVPTVRVSSVPHAVLRAAGLAVPFLRELEEMRHSFTGRYEVDAAVTTAELGLTATPLATTWEQTMGWWSGRQARAGVPAG